MQRIATATGLLALAILVSGSVMQAQGPARSIIVVTPKKILVVGEQVQLDARTRDQSGMPRRGEVFTWSSTNSGVVSVDATGLATANGLGIATIAAAIGGLRATVILQTFPQRVDILADRYQISVGEQLQFAAVAVDVHEQIIPNVPFRWEWTGANGFSTRTATVSPTGLFSALAAGAVTVKAVIAYTAVPTGMSQSFVGYTHIVITNRQDFRLHRILANDPLPGPLRFRPNRMEFATNDSGQMAFVADLNGLTNALIRYDNGRFQTLASAGTPAPIPGVLISGFQTPSINNRGDVLANMQASRGGGQSGSALVLFDKSGAGKPVFVQNQSEGAFQRINNLGTTRYSLNDSGSILFSGNFSLSGGRGIYAGLFRLTGADLQAVTTTLDALPGLPRNYYYGFNQFGIDRNGVAYFMATTGTQSAIYRADGQSAPTRIVGTGDNLSGFVVENILSLGISPAGNIAFTAWSVNGQSNGFRYRTGDRTPQMLTSADWVQYGPISINDAGDVVAIGTVSQSWGLHRWSGNTVTPVVPGGGQVDGGAIDGFYDASITSQGRAYTNVSTSENDSVILRADTREVLFKAGQLINVTANLNFFGFVPGAGAGPAHLLTGGWNRSIHEVAGQSLIPMVTSGDRLAADIKGFTVSSATRSRSGTLYYAGYYNGGNAIFSYSSGRTEKVFQTPVTIATSSSASITLNWIAGDSNFVASNDGTIVFTAYTSLGQNALVSHSRGQTRLLANVGGNGATASPSGGQFESMDFNRTISVDDRGRIAAFFNVRNGPSGIFLYENGAWRTVSLLRDLRFDGQSVNGVVQLYAANEKLLAAFATGFFTVIAEYANGQWTPIINRGQILPGGSEITFVTGIPVFNGNGDVACAVFTNGGTIIVMRAADGTFRMVYNLGDVTEAGDLFPSNAQFELDLRDDRRLYLIANSLYEQRVLYVAEPLF